MKTIRGGPLPLTHPDYLVVKAIEDALLHQAGGMEKLASELPPLIRLAIDEVIDTIRTGRVTESELEKTEKTYIGTKIEILIRNYFRLPKGILDLNIDGFDVDVKNTLRDTWMIPREAINKPCILIASDEKRQSCYFGIFIARRQYLTEGANQDKKRSVSAAGFKSIHWLITNAAYPKSFWSQIGSIKTQKIMRGATGNERISSLFRDVQRKPIHRDIVQAVGQQKDYMKRLRRNGGARDLLASEGIAILSGNYDAALINALQLGKVERHEFISLRAETAAEAELLSAAGKLW